VRRGDPIPEDRECRTNSENTLGYKREAGTGLSGYCLTCKRTALLDVAEVVKRFGPDQGCMH